MQLSSTIHFKGWDIRYDLLRSNNIVSEEPHSGEPIKAVVFVHGTPWSSVVYRSIVEALLVKPSYQILIYDLPGYGLSQHYSEHSGSTTSRNFPGDTSVKFQAEALAALLGHLTLDGRNHSLVPAVIAHDIAGAIVLRAHLLHGIEFESMMLLDTNAVLPWGDGFYKLVRDQPSPFLELPPSIFEAVVRAVIQSACHDPKVLETGWEDDLARPWIGRLNDSGNSTEERQRSFVRQIAQADDSDVAEMLEADSYSQVRCDVKIVWGEEDQWIPKQKVEDLAKRLKGRMKECVFIPKAGHLVMLDQPARVAIEVFDWLNRSDGRRLKS